MLVLKLVTLATSARGAADITLAMWHTGELLSTHMQLTANTIGSLSFIGTVLDSTNNDEQDEELFLSGSYCLGDV